MQLTLAYPEARWSGSWAFLHRDAAL